MKKKGKLWKETFYLNLPHVHYLYITSNVAVPWKKSQNIKRRDLQGIVITGTHGFLFNIHETWKYLHFCSILFFPYLKQRSSIIVIKVSPHFSFTKPSVVWQAAQCVRIALHWKPENLDANLVSIIWYLCNFKDMIWTRLLSFLICKMGNICLAFHIGHL